MPGPASDEIGTDLPLLMTITNDTAEPDAILRVRCPFANFSESTPSIVRRRARNASDQVHSDSENKDDRTQADGYHVMLL
jgi:hypothetical protein